MRRYRCPDCPPGQDEHDGEPKGRLPERCPVHRRQRRSRKERVRRSGLRVVAAQAAGVAAGEPQGGAGDVGDVVDVVKAARSLAATVRADLGALLTSHPARDTLVALAERLAEAADAPYLIADPRALPSIARELRATVQELVDHQGADEHDLFGDEDLPTKMVNSEAI